jgi:hypothetical protein
MRTALKLLDNQGGAPVARVTGVRDDGDHEVFGPLVILSC